MHICPYSMKVENKIYKYLLSFSTEIAANADPEVAERQILDNLKWRKERNMDKIHEEGLILK